MDIQLGLSPKEDPRTAQRGSSKPEVSNIVGVSKNVKANRSRSPHPAVHDPGGHNSNDELETGNELRWDRLPTTNDLAQSFLLAEPPEEKEELRAAIASQSQCLQDSTVSSDDAESELGMGTAVGLSLPGFVAGFLKGVSDRLEVRVKHIELSLSTHVSADAFNGAPLVSRGEPVALKVSIEDVNVENQLGATGQEDEIGEQRRALETSHTPAKSDVAGKRCITLRNIRCFLISDATTFSILSRPSAPPSSSSAKTDHTGPTHAQQTSHPSDSSLSSTGGLGLTESTILHASEDSDPHAAGLEASVATSDGERFGDAGKDDDNDDNDVQSSSVSGSSTTNDSMTRDQLLDSRFHDDDLEDSAIVPAFALDASFASLPTTSHGQVQGRNEMRGNPEYSNSAQTSSGGTLLSSSRQSPKSIAKSHLGRALQTYSPQGHAASPKNRTDNLMSSAQALQELSISERAGSGVEVQPTEDLSESKLFSHEEAASMYMSAISHNSANDTDAVPGAWDASSPTYADREPSSSSSTASNKSKISDNPERDQSPSPTGISTSSMRATVHDDHEASATPDQRSEHENRDNSIFGGELGLRESPMEPRADQETLSGSDSSNSPESSYGPTLLAKRILHIDQCRIRLPIEHLDTTESASKLEVDAVSSSSGLNMPEMPGAFSSAFDQREPSMKSRKAPTRGIGKPELFKTSSRRGNESAVQSDLSASVSYENGVTLDTSTVHAQMDVSVGRLFAVILQQLLASLDGPGTSTKDEGDGALKAPVTESMSIKNISLKLVEHLSGVSVSSEPQGSVGFMDTAEPPSTDVLLTSTMKHLQIVRKNLQGSSTVQFSVAQFLLGYATENILSFDAGLKMRDSIRDDQTLDGKDLSVSVVRTPESCKVNITTLPIHIRLDLQRLDETFGWFGGFSGILELGSSMASTTTVMSACAGRAQSPKRSRTVRFASTAEQDILGASKQTSMNKVNARIGGFVLDLSGRQCNIRVESSAMKLVSREEGVGMQVDLVKLDGPKPLHEDRESSITASLANIRVEYLSTPKEVDLARLLSLLTPSADKYDHDDDILVETLLRQRRQGGVLRITMANARCEVLDLDCFKYFPTLIDDASKLSTVAKYLPEDDRPGILTLGLIRNLGIHVRAKQAVGDIQSTMQNLELAHVGLPLLLALCVEKLGVERDDDGELVGEALASHTPGPQGRTPMVMARMIGDEMEPIVKIKLWNIRTEYRVRTVMAILGLSDTMTVEDVTADMVSSIVTLTRVHVKESTKAPRPHSESPSNSTQSTPGSKPMNVDIGLRDCIIGLNPLDLPHKGLFVLTDTRFSGSILKHVISLPPYKPSRL